MASQNHRPPVFFTPAPGEMVENGEDCAQVLIQLAAVKSAINNTGKVILKDHLNHCIVEAAKNGDQKALDDLSAAIDQFVK